MISLEHCPNRCIYAQPYKVSALSECKVYKNMNIFSKLAIANWIS